MSTFTKYTWTLMLWVCFINIPVLAAQTKKNQQIRFAKIPKQHCVSTKITLVAQASSGLPVHFESNDWDIAEVCGNQLLLKAEGICTIKAIQCGNDEYHPAKIICRKLEIRKKAQKISVEQIPVLVLGQVHEYQINAASNSDLPLRFISKDETIATVCSQGKIYPKKAGIVKIKIFQEGNECYREAKKVFRYVTITGARWNQTIRSDTLQELKACSTKYTLAYVSSSGLPVRYEVRGPESVISAAGNNLYPIGAGVFTVTAFQDGDHRFGPARPVTHILRVSTCDQSIHFDSLLQVAVCSTKSVALRAYTDAGLPVRFSLSGNWNVASLSQNVLSIRSAGIVTVTAFQDGNPAYAPAIPVRRVLRVNKCDQEITFDEFKPMSACANSLPINAYSNSGLRVSYRLTGPDKVVHLKENLITPLLPGIVTITAFQSGNNFYNPAVGVSRELTVTKCTQNISFEPLPASIPCNQTVRMHATSTSLLTVGFRVEGVQDIVHISGNLITPLKNGVITLTAFQNGSHLYEPAIPVSQVLTLLGCNETLDFYPVPSIQACDTGLMLQAKSSLGGNVLFRVSGPEGVVSIVGNKMYPLQMGVVTITAYLPQKPSANIAVVANQVVTIGGCSQQITFFEPPTIFACDTARELLAQSTSALEVQYNVVGPTSVIRLQGNKIYPLQSGVVTITAIQSGNQNYLPAVPVHRQIAIQGCHQSIEFSPLPKVTVCDTAVRLQATSTSGLPVLFEFAGNPHVIQWNGTSFIPLQTGVITITAYQPGNKKIAAANRVHQIVEIGRCPQRIAFSTLPKVSLCDSSIVLQAKASSGFKVVYRVYGDSGTVIVKDNIARFLNTGVITITAFQNGTQRFEPAEPVHQVLEIGKCSQTLVFHPLEPKKVGDPDFFLDAKASSGLPVMYTLTGDNQVLAIQENRVKILQSGVITITAFQPGNDQYAPAPKVSRQLYIFKTKLCEKVIATLTTCFCTVTGKPNVVIVTVQSADSTYRINDTTAVLKTWDSAGVLSVYAPPSVPYLDISSDNSDNFFYPNPANEYIHIPDLKISEVQIRNTASEVVWQSAYISDVYIGHLPPGQYVLLLVTSKRTISKKLIIIR